MSGHQLKSFRDLGRSSGGGQFLKAWKEQGSVLVWMHRELPWMRRIHNSWGVVEEIDARTNQPYLRVAWKPFVCWEPDAYFARRKSRDRLAAVSCPMDLLIEHLEVRPDLGGEVPIFRFQASPNDCREVCKADLIGVGAEYRNKMTAQSEYLFFV